MSSSLPKAPSREVVAKQLLIAKINETIAAYVADSCPSIRATHNDKGILASYLSSFVLSAIDKYEKGSKEHGGSLFEKSASIDLSRSLEEEMTDSLMYIHAMRLKTASFITQQERIISSQQRELEAHKKTIEVLKAASIPGKKP